MPFRFHDEISTSDVAFEAWGGTQEEMFTSSAEALLNTMADAPELVRRSQEFTFRLEHAELDMLLFMFLQELIFYKDARRLLLHADTVLIKQMEGIFTMTATVSGEQIDAARHHPLVDVKAVTLHCFQVGYIGNAWKAVVVLDV